MSNIKEVFPESLEPHSEWNLIGRGHFGDVFKVKHKQLRIDVAVKKLKENVHLEELLAEAEKIKHASENHYVIPLFGIMKAPPCIVMQWMEYGCLGTLIEKVKEIPWALKYRFLHEVAIGMNWLHCLSPPLLHLDLKPRNVLLNDGLHIQITDFGLSKYTSSSVEADGGTIEYMPPEAFQEQYNPSEASDIYSFAILSAVVLRGEDPYPAPCSSLIKVLVPQGQRPEFEFLENINSVKNLEKAIAFTRLCWHNDKRQRPSFRDCCLQWEKFISAYKEKEIKDAVRTVQNMMDCTDSPSSRTDVQQSAPNTKDMSEMIRSLETIKIEEPPSAKLEAVPSRTHGSSHLRGGSSQPLRSGIQPSTNVINHGPGTPNYRTGIERNPQSQYRGQPNPNPNQKQMLQQGQVGFSQGTNSSVYRTGNVRNPQRVQSQVTQPSSRPAYSQWGPFMYPPPSFPMSPGPQGFHPSFSSNVQHSFFPSNFNFPSPPPTANSTNISVTNNEGPFQLGDNNNMFYGTTKPHHYSNIKQRTQPPGMTRPTSYPAPTQKFNVHISNNSGPLQIGDNNLMYVRGSSQYQRSNTQHITPQPDQTTHISPLIPTKSVHSPQPSHTSEVRLPTKAGEAFSDAVLPAQETERQTNQPLEKPTTTDTTVSNSLLEKDNINSSSSSEERENSKQ